MKTSIFLDRFHTIKLREIRHCCCNKAQSGEGWPSLISTVQNSLPNKAFFTLELPFSVTHCWNKSSRFWFCTHNKFIIPLVRRWPSAVFRSRDFWSLKWYQIAQAFKLIVVLFLFKQIQTSYSSLSKL